MDTERFEHLAAILSYPTRRLQDHVERLRREALAPAEAARLNGFADFIAATATPRIEELFTRTFDLNPSCCLEIGWHLYGEEYERGAFLVHMRQALAEEGLEETAELPDHISHCLRLLPRLEPEDAVAFSHRFLQPALAKIMRAMEKDNPYACVLELLGRVLEQRYGVVEKREDDVDARLIELPVLNNVLHYRNTEDMAGAGRDR